MIIGYARVSIVDQNLDAQTDALEAASAERIFSDKISCSMRKRPELDKLLDQLRPSDVTVVAKKDRLARSLRDLLDIVEAIKDRGAGFRSLAEDIDTTTPTSRLVFHFFPSIAQFHIRTHKRGIAGRKGAWVGRWSASCPYNRSEGISKPHV